jgi:hypothetical protein
MGHIFAEIKLSNPRNQILTPVVTRALADTGALMLCIPEHIAIQLELKWIQSAKLQLQMVDQ